MTRKENHQMWAEIVHNQKLSGCPQSKWCKENNVKIHNFRYWKKRLTKTPETNEGINGAMWAAVTSEFECQQESTPFINLMLGNIVVKVEKGFDDELLKNIIKVLNYHAE